MKRNMELIRGMLAEIEALPAGATYETDDSSLKGDRGVLAAHLTLLSEAGFVRRVDQEASGNAICSGLTWQGHEFLSATRSDTVWAEAKRVLREKGLVVTFELVKDLCSSLARQQLGLHSELDASPSPLGFRPPP